MAERVVSVKVNANVTGAVASMRKLKASVDDLTKADVQKPQKAFADISNKAALMGGVVALGIGKAVASFADFDAAMSAASAATGAAGAEMEQLRDLAIKAGQDTQFSATEAAQGITEMAKAGVAAKDIMGGGLKGALDLAAAGQLDVGRASEIAATALNQFQLQGKDLPHVADLFAAAAGKAQGSVDDIANAMKFVGPVAQSLNISIEETTGILGEFASQGIIGEQAGTSFRGMLLSLTSPSKQARDTMKDLGIEIYNADGSMKSMSEIAQVLHDRLGPLDEATRNQALGQIFGNEQITAATVLYKGGGAAVDEWTKKVNDAGFAQEQAAKKTDNLKGDIERLGGSIETAFIENGSAANGALRTLTQGLGFVVDVVAKIPAPVTLAVTALAGIALTLPKGVSVYKNFTGSLDTLGISMEKLTTKAPRLASSLKGLQGAVAGLAIVGTIGAVTNAFTKLSDVTIDPQKIADGAVSLADFNKQMAASADLGAPLADTLSNFDQVIEATFNAGAGQNVDNFFQTLNSGLGFANNSDIQVASKRFEDLDKVLSQLVSGGQGEAAARLFKQVTDAAALQGVSVDQVKSKLPGYAQAVVDAGKAAQAAAPQVAELTEQEKGAAKAAEEAAKHHEDNAKAILDAFAQIGGATDDLTARIQEKAQKQADATKDPKDSWSDYADTVKLSAKDIVKVLDEQTKAAENFRKNLLEVQKRGDEDFLTWVSQQPPAVAAAYASGTEKQKQKIYDAWKRNVGAQQGKGIVDGLNGSKPAVKTAADKIHEAAQKALGVKIVIPTTISPPAQEAVASVVSALRKAIGVLAVPTKPMPITGTVYTNPYFVRRASGGPIYGPGTKTSDSIPLWASAGEFMQKAAAVDKYGLAFMHAVNNLTFPKEMARGYAGGGEITRAYRSAPASVSIGGRMPSAAAIGAAVAAHLPPMITAVGLSTDQVAAGVSTGLRNEMWRMDRS